MQKKTRKRKAVPKKAKNKPLKSLRSKPKPGRKVISARLRYELLARANFRCQACGVPASKARLEIDHKFPLSLGGRNVISNYQVLCLKCNRGKGAKRFSRHPS